MINLVIFSGSNKPKFFHEIKVELEKIGSNLDTKKYHIWYGGGKEGLMSVLPLSFFHSGGFVSSIDWKYFMERYGSIPFFNNIITETFWERQKKLVQVGDIYLCLPGGVGTLSELFDVLVKNDIYHSNKKIILFSYKKFFHDILVFLKEKIEMGFIKERHLENIKIFQTSDEILSFLNNLYMK